MSSPLVRARNTLGTGPLGRWAIARALSWMAPYFRTIRPQITRLDPGHVEVRIRKRWAVTNHIGTVHAIAMCNIAELAAGTGCELSTPDHLRWIPVGMTVSYEKLARTDLRGVCAFDPDLLATPGDKELPVEVFDTQDQRVFTARVTMRLSERRTTGAATPSR